MISLDIPIKGIQVFLIFAFFLHIFGWGTELSGVLTDYANADIGLSRSLIGRKMEDFAYGFFYLGEVAVIEMLHRIWASMQSSPKEGS